MIYVFENGRIIYTSDLLVKEDNDKYIAVEKLPEIPEINGKYGVLRADKTTNKLVLDYFDIVVPPAIDAPTVPEQPTAIPETTSDDLRKILLLTADMVSDLIDITLEGGK